MEEEGDRVKLLVGIGVVVVVLVIGFFILRGLTTKKSNPLPSSMRGVSPTLQVQATEPVSPTSVGPTNTPNQSKGSTYYYSNHSQGSSNYQTQQTQSQSQNGTNESQSQTLPSGMVQNQNQ